MNRRLLQQALTLVIAAVAMTVASLALSGPAAFGVLVIAAAAFGIAIVSPFERVAEDGSTQLP